MEKKQLDHVCHDHFAAALVQPPGAPGAPAPLSLAEASLTMVVREPC